jgi:hypothetical protein
MFIKIIINIFIIIFAIFMGYIFYKIIETNILIPSCIIKTESCQKIVYYSYGNSALINIPSSGYWIWYNDGMVYTYGQKNTLDCPPNFESVYVTDITNNSPTLSGFQCNETFNNILDIFKSKGSEKYFYIQKDPKKILDLFQILEIFKNRNIINVKTTT